MLADLARENSFVIPLDVTRTPSRPLRFARPVLSRHVVNVQ
jgi:hypothetical protein